MATELKSLAQAIRERRSTPSFVGEPIPASDLRQILDAGLQAPSGYNLQPWRFVVVQHPEQKRRLRAASYNQAKVEEASAVIVACGDRDGWRRDLDEILHMGYDTAPLEGFEQRKVCETLRLPISYFVVALLAIGHVQGQDKFNGGRFDLSHTVFGEEFGKPLR